MIEIQNLSKTFHLKTGDVRAVQNVSLSIADGQVYGIIGYSGAGKSTLVRCLNLLEVPDGGEIRIGADQIVLQNGRIFRRDQGGLRRIGERQLCALRSGIGMIFQHFNLLDRSTVYENIAYPLKYSGMKAGAVRERVYELLDLVDLRDKVNVYPAQLSGGQKQRVAIARALANNPRVLLSDEATSALDPDATESILALLKDLNRKLGLTIVLITHEMAVIKAVCDRVAVMEDGRVVEEGSVYEIFAHPQTGITRRFVDSSSPLGKIDRLLEEQSPLVEIGPGQKLVKLIFRKECVGEAIVTRAAREFGLDFSIVLANVEYLQGGPIGGLIGVVSGKKEDLKGGLRFLDENHVTVEVLRDGDH